MLEELQVKGTNSRTCRFLRQRTDVHVSLVDQAGVRCSCRSSVVAECRDLCEWVGVSRTQATIHHWYQSYAEYYEQNFTVEPNRLAVNEKQIQLEEKEKEWLYAAIDIDSKVVLLIGAAIGWRYRIHLISGLAVLTPLARGLARIVPFVSSPTQQTVACRLQRFVEVIERLGSDPLRLALVFGVGLAGQLAVAATLWVALAALGFVAPFVVILLIVLVAKVSDAAPTPGGFGSAEVLLMTLLVATTGVKYGDCRCSRPSVSCQCVLVADVHGSTGSCRVRFG
jgi:hypothetical protein